MRNGFVWGLLAAASLGDACVLIDYGQRISAVEDGGSVEPVDEDAGFEASLTLDASADARSDARDVLKDAEASAKDAERDDASADASADASSDAATDAAVACSTTNECGGCEPLVASVGASCGACGVGRYACDGSEALLCANDARPASPGNPVLIDDLEDGNEDVLPNYGLSGEWYMVSDGTAGTLVPPKGSVPVPTDVGAAGSVRSMHFTASGFTRWGAGMAVSLSAFGCGYDASKQSGIEFHVKGSGTVALQIGTVQTAPAADHGTCVTGCNDLFGTTFTANGSWTLRKIAFSSLAQTGWGTPATFDPSQALYVQFLAPANGNVDVYIDNLSFY